MLLQGQLTDQLDILSSSVSFSSSDIELLVVYQARPSFARRPLPTLSTCEKGSSKGQCWNAIRLMKPYECVLGSKARKQQQVAQSDIIMFEIK